jgi:hypothetical protein
MVSGEEGQLYTIEGFAAALIMIMTAYLVVNATSVYTAGDTHISDMQLEVLGSDALKMIGTPVNTSMNSVDRSPLSDIIESDLSNPINRTKFNATFFDLINTRTLQDPNRFIQYTANYTCRNTTNGDTIESYPISYSRNLTGGEHTVRVTKWVIVNKGTVPLCGTTNKDRAILVEVLMWQD